MKIFIITLIVLFNWNINYSQVDNTGVIRTDTITSKDSLDKYVEKIITIKGKITNTKIPTIIEVDVSCQNANELKNKTVIATGVLIKTVVKKVDKYTQNRGVGTFYRLVEPNSEFEAEVKMLKIKLDSEN